MNTDNCIFCGHGKGWHKDGVCTMCQSEARHNYHTINYNGGTKNDE